MRRRRTHPRRRDAPRWTAEDWEAATFTLLTRDRGRCPWCTRPLDDRAERHHRRRARDGGDRYSNLLLMHPECHAAAHGSPERARSAGVIVPVFGAPPPTWPVMMDGRWWLLDDAGNRRVVP